MGGQSKTVGLVICPVRSVSVNAPLVVFVALHGILIAQDLMALLDSEAHFPIGFSRLYWKSSKEDRELEKQRSINHIGLYNGNSANDVLVWRGHRGGTRQGKE